MLRDTWIRERADALQRDRVGVAGGEFADARRGAGDNDIARFERHEAREELHEERYREDQVVGAGVLPQFAIQMPGETQPLSPQPDCDARAERREGVEPFRPHPLVVGKLHVRADTSLPTVRPRM